MMRCIKCNEEFDDDRFVCEACEKDHAKKLELIKTQLKKENDQTARKEFTERVISRWAGILLHSAPPLLRYADPKKLNVSPEQRKAVTSALAAYENEDNLFYFCGGESRTKCSLRFVLEVLRERMESDGFSNFTFGYLSLYQFYKNGAPGDLLSELGDIGVLYLDNFHLPPPQLRTSDLEYLLTVRRSHDKLTIVNSNCRPDQLPQKYERPILDLMRHMRVIEC